MLPSGGFNLLVSDEDNVPTLPNEGSTLQVLWEELILFSFFFLFFFVFSIFLESLFIFIAQCSNKRLALQKVKENSNIAPTDALFLGISLVMDYNKHPEIYDYWSQEETIGKRVYKKS